MQDKNDSVISQAQEHKYILKTPFVEIEDILIESLPNEQTMQENNLKLDEQPTANLLPVMFA